MDNDSFIVVTGGAGFIGSAFLRYLNDAGYSNIIVVDSLDEDDKWRNLVGKKYYDYIDKLDFFDWLGNYGDKVSQIVHLGACSSTVEKDAGYLMENNYRYTRSLATWAIAKGVRFVYASSAATYGDGNLGFSDDHSLLPKFKPLNMYGYSKHMVDLWAQEEGFLDNICGLKFFNVFGPNEFHKGRMASAINHLLPQIEKEGMVKLFKSSEPEKYDDGAQLRDFVYVKDVVKMIYAFMNNSACGIFNVGRGEASSWNELAEAVFTAVDKPVNISYIDMPTDLIGKYQNYTCADTAKTCEALGDDATTTPLKEAVVEYVRDYILPGKTW